MKFSRYSFSLISIFILFYLLPVNTRLLWQPDETRYAEISREMLDRGDWVVPHFFGLHYLEKPIFGYWINSVIQLIFGDSNLSVRLGSIFSVFLTLLCVVRLTWNIWKEKHIAYLAGIIFLTLLIVYGVGTYATFDSIVSFWLAVIMCNFWSAIHSKKLSIKVSNYLLIGIACGIGVITKGFIVLVIPFISIFPWAIFQKCWREILLFGWLSVFSCILTIFPWGLEITLHDKNFWKYFFWIEHIQRFAKNNAQHKSPFWFYFPYLLVGSIPWTFLLPGAMYQCFYDKNIKCSGYYLLSWIVMPFLFFSVAKGKLVTYILPCFTPLSILMSYFAVQAAKNGNQLLRMNSAFNIGCGVLGIVIVLMISPFGITKHSIWTKYELNKVFYVITTFLIWILISWITLKKYQTRWWLVAYCPMGLIFLIGSCIPNKIIYFKQPQFFIKTFYRSLINSQFVLSNNIGIASSLAWELKRSDIIIYEHKGELEYWLNNNYSYSNLIEHYISKKDFKSWLEKHRNEGVISLVLLLSKHDDVQKMLIPKPDTIFSRGNIVYLKYFPSYCKQICK